MNDLDNIFDDKKLKRAVRKARIRNIITIIIVSIIVFMVGNYVNMRITLKYSVKAYEANNAIVKLSSPNAYISTSDDIFGILGGTGTYRVSKTVGGRNVILEDRISIFGLRPPLNYSRYNGGGPTSFVATDWQSSTWEYGYRKMRFFHPELQYKEYQNDLENIDKIPDDKVIEMAISFDKSYKIGDMFTVATKLEPAKITWLWLNEFTDEKMEEYKYEVDNYDARACGVEENYAVGIRYHSKNTFSFRDYNELYDELIDNLSKSYMLDHKKLYEEIMERGETKSEDAKVLGVVVQGTKEQLKELVGNPMIKASVFGIIVDPIY